MEPLVHCQRADQHLEDGMLLLMPLLTVRENLCCADNTKCAVKLQRRKTSMAPARSASCAACVSHGGASTATIAGAASLCLTTTARGSATALAPATAACEHLSDMRACCLAPIGSTCLVSEHTGQSPKHDARLFGSPIEA